MPTEEAIQSLSHLDPEVEEAETTNEVEEAEESEDGDDEVTNPLDFLDSDDEELPEDDDEDEEKISADVDDEDSDEADDADEGEEPEVDDEEKQDEPVEAIPTELLIEAGKAGMDAETVKAFPNAASLKAAIGLVQPKAAEAKADDGEGQGEQKSETPEVELEFEDFTFEVPDDFDDETKELLEGMASKFNEHTKAQMKKLAETFGKGDPAASAEVAQLKQQIEETNRRQFFEWYDSQMESMGQEWQGVFGKGSMESLDVNSDAAQNRINLTIEMDKLHQSHPDWDKKKLLDNAIRIAFPSEHEKITTEKSSRKKREYRDERVTQKPTARNKEIAAPKSNKKAKGVAASMLKKLGF